MSVTVLVISLVAAVLFVAVGVQITARQLQRHPLDSSRPGPLIDTTRRTSWVVRPLELEQLNSIVTESMSSDAVARSKLWPLLNELVDDAPRPVTSPSMTDRSSGRPTGRRGRVSLLETRLTDLERAWGLSDGSNNNEDGV